MSRKLCKSEIDLEALTNEAALGALNANRHLEMRLHKKYCLDAFEFIRHIEEGMSPDGTGAAAARIKEQGGGARINGVLPHLNLNPKQQVNRIAKNMIDYVLSLASIFSRLYMFILPSSKSHLTRLQVLDEPFQRRGAIVILGMPRARKEAEAPKQFRAGTQQPLTVSNGKWRLDIHSISIKISDGATANCRCHGSAPECTRGSC
ncbi:hypothetical protein C8Q74DRAFT_1218657 [Fomes fomentarius]|nr:hypothetical protein C8Q74DRAFT_1218657 [Fomes fomentarius]